MSTTIPTPTVVKYHGIAAADKDNDSRELLVYCPDLLPGIDGELEATTIETTVNTTGDKGEYSKPLKTTNSITCYYYESNDLSALPPDVRKGENVQIWNVADTDTWYWEPMGSNSKLRRTERKRISANATLDNVSSGTDDKEYIFEMSTRNAKYIKIQTSKDLGEAFAYTIMIDADNSKLMVTDDTNNTFVIDSPNKRVTMTNVSKSTVDLFDKNINIGCEGDIVMSAYQGNIYMSAKQNIETTSGVDTIVTSEANTNMIAKAQWTQLSEQETMMTSNATRTDKSAKAMSFATDDSYTLTSAKAMSISTEDSYTLTSAKTMSMSTQDAYSLSSQKDATINSSANISLTAAQNIAGSCQSLAIAFAGGSLGGSGGNISMQASMVDVKSKMNVGA